MKNLTPILLVTILTACGTLGIDTIKATEFLPTRVGQNVNVDFFDCDKQSRDYIHTTPGVTYLHDPYRNFITNCMLAKGYRKR
jgi:hypothetical protein